MNVPLRLRKQLIPLYSTLYPSLKDSFSFDKQYSPINVFTVVKDKFKYLENFFTFTQLTELTKSMNTVETLWLKRYCHTILSKHLPRNSNEMTVWLKVTSILAKSSKFMISNSALD
jgi:hypothetical protein